MQKSPENYRLVNNRLLILTGVFILLCGTLVYLYDRSNNPAWFISVVGLDLSVYTMCPDLFGPLGGSLPSFTHVLACILITASFLGPTERRYRIVSLAWCCIDCLAELGQKYSQRPVDTLPDWIATIPFSGKTLDYFAQGTFDWLDLAAVLAGTLCGYLLLIITINNGVSHEC